MLVRNLIKPALFTCLMMLALPTIAQEYRQGFHFHVVPSGSTASSIQIPGKVEVASVSWFKCPHCFKMEPALQSWLSNNQKSVNFQRVHGTGPSHWNTPAKAMAAILTLKLGDEVVTQVFDHLHETKGRLRTEEDYAGFIAKVSNRDLAEVKEAMNSTLTTLKLKKWNRLMKAWGIEAVPQIVVGGKYRVDLRKAGTYKNAFKVVDFLVKKIESEK